MLAHKPHDFEKLCSPMNTAFDWCGAGSVDYLALETSIKPGIYLLPILMTCQFTNEPNREISRGVFQNRGVCRQAYPLIPSPSSLLLSVFAPIPTYAL